MREYGRAHSKLSNNLETAKDNELVFTNGDLIIKKANGKNISLYNKLVEDCVDKEIIGNVPAIYGFTINFNEPNPYDAITYIENNTQFKPLSNDDGVIHTNSWSDRIIRHELGIRPCLFKDGKVICYLDSNDYTKDIYGNDVGNIRNADVMIEFKRMWCRYILGSNCITFKIANYEVDETYTTIFKEKYMYISAYNVFVSNGIPASRPGNILSLNENNNIIKSKLKAGYSLLSYDKYMYILSLSWLLTKSFNPLDLIGKNISRITGILDNKGLFYNGNIGNKFLGFENFWQYYTYIDGIATSKNSLYTVDNAGIKNVLLQDIFKDGWISGLGYRKGVIYPSSYNGSSSTHVCSYVTNKNNEDLNFSNIYFGGLEEDPEHTGVFSLFMKEPKYVGYRLCYN